MARPSYVHSRRDEPSLDPKWVAVAVIVGAVGLKGMVRVKSFSDDLAAILSAGPVTLFSDKLSKGAQHDGKLLHRVKQGFACALSGISDRTAAEKMRGVKLYVKRDSLPRLEDDDSYYRRDMEGLMARDTQGNEFGIVCALHNFGAGDIVEIRLMDMENRPASGTKMYPFRDEYVPEVNIRDGYLVIDRAAYGEDD